MPKEASPLKQRCKARAKGSGEQCRHWAMLGQTVCRNHGGGAPAARAAGKRRVAAAKAKAVIGKLDIAPVEDPFSAMQQLAGELLAIKDKFRDKVETLEQVRWRGDSEQLRAEVAVYSQLLRDCTAVLTSLARIGLDERMVRIKEAQADMIKKAIDGALRDAGLEGAALAAARTGVARRLRVVPAA
jgi:hypothetical protein